MQFSELHTYISNCIKNKIPFAVYSLPGDCSFKLLESADTDKFLDSEFSVSRFGKAWPDQSPIVGNETIESTKISDYALSFELIQSELTGEDEKVVLSRVQNVFSEKNPVAVAQNLFDKHTECFRYMFFSPKYGLWFGATPEFLLEYDYLSHQFVTMALAGTRRLSKTTEWDEKNIREHNAVCAFIEQTLSKLNIDFIKSETNNVTYGDIEHLCHIYNGFLESTPTILINSLNPTPAVCGFPQDKAMKIIQQVEKHDRIYYSGLIGVKQNNHLSVFVNLRCCKVSILTDSYCYHLYAGGGINSLSNCAEEWLETESKMESILNAINAKY